MTLLSTPALGHTEERRLVWEAQQGSKAATAALVQSQLRYLRTEARKYAGASGVSIDDLVSAGTEALLLAIRSFELGRGTRLWTHAHRAIAEAMADEVAAYSSTIPIPGRTLRKYRRAIRESKTLAEARALAQSREGLDPETFDAVHTTLTGGVPMEGTATSLAFGSGASGDHGGIGPDMAESRIPDDAVLLGGAQSTNPLASVEERDLVRRAMAALDDRQRAVIALAYGPEGLDNQAIADRLGMSRPTASRAHRDALLAMRAAVGDAA